MRFSSIRASHVLVSSTLGVRLSGLRHCTSSIKRNRRGHVLHDMHVADTNLLWLAPEILRQVALLVLLANYFVDL